MTLRFVSAGTYLVKLYLLMMFIVQQVQGYPLQTWQRLNPFYNNENTKPRYNPPRFSNDSLFSPYNPSSSYNRLSDSPNLDNTIWDPERISNFFLQKIYASNQYTSPSGWFNNRFSGITNFQTAMPTTTFPRMTQMTQTKQGQGKLSQGKKSTFFDEDTWKDGSTHQEMTKFQQKQANMQEESTFLRDISSFSTNEVIINQSSKLDHQSNTTCRDNCEEASEDSSGYVKPVQSNTELPDPDEWIKRKENSTNVSRKSSQTLPEQQKPLKTSDKNISSLKERNHMEKEHEYVDSFIFPDEAMRLNGSKFSIDSVPICDQNGLTFCVNATHYPEELVNLAIQQNKSLNLLTTTDEVSSIADRFDISDEEPLCRSYTRIVYPRSAETLKRHWLYVVNQNNFKQGIRVQICLEEGNACGELEELSPEGYKILCKQAYIYRELAAISTEGIVFKDLFRLPSNCCCQREPAEMFVNLRN